uniref:Uncharacterized protein n=1 Tax=Physcomitrium patens TaxID=3218 RepID=A0A2K1JVW2_PHYPA|nr:hypothetical protein PHYPA_015432 [Physcomitrium patens]
MVSPEPCTQLSVALPVELLASRFFTPLAGAVNAGVLRRVMALGGDRTGQDHRDVFFSSILCFSMRSNLLVFIPNLSYFSVCNSDFVRHIENNEQRF